MSILKNAIACLLAVAACLLSGCVPETTDLRLHAPLRIEARLSPGFGTNSSTRSGDSPQLLPAGAAISFFAQGGLEASGTILTYNGTRWSGDLPNGWNTQEQTARIAAYYPPLPDESAAFYDAEGRLTDIYYAHQECATGSSIHLSFKHLFAQITFQADASLNASLQQIRFLPSRQIASVSPHTATVETLPATGEAILSERQETGSYTFLIPPASDMHIDIELTDTDGQTRHARLEPHTFLSGTAYRCRIGQQGNGISTADEFIAFTRLMNGNSYKDYTLEQFRTEEDGVLTYRLNNSITFTESERKQVEIIKDFKDVFDGQGYMLSGLNISPIKDGTIKYYGLFRTLHETGVIRHLTLRNADLTVTANYEAAALVGESRGKVDDCHVDSLFITHTASSGRDLAGLVMLNKGYLYNSSLNYGTVKKNGKYAPFSFGGIAGTNLKGHIVNCAASDLHIPRKKIENIGWICRSLYDGNIHNCYVYNYTTSTYAHALVGTIDDRSVNYTVSYCYYDSTEKYIIDNSQFDIAANQIRAYNAKTLKLADGTPLADRLNAWLAGEGAAKYPGLKLYQWERRKGENIPVIWVKPAD